MIMMIKHNNNDSINNDDHSNDTHSSNTHTNNNNHDNEYNNNDDNNDSEACQMRHVGRNHACISPSAVKTHKTNEAVVDNTSLLV